MSARPRWRTARWPAISELATPRAGAIPATRGLLRLATAGSVDDGKSTLIGRLMHDAKAILADQFDDLRARDGSLDLSRLTDGLRAEREQGITIDVAYRYFATPRRAFVLADTPGHLQYTRNMVTGASTADLAVVLVDARNGVVEQTRRHAFIASLLGIPRLVVAVNKMDLVGFSEEAFDAVVRDFPALDVAGVTFIPVSALRGDNVVERSSRTPWYAGPSLLAELEAVELEHDRDDGPLRLPVQYVIRDSAGDYRGYAGRVAGGVVRPGDAVTVLPAGRLTTIAAIDSLGGTIDAAHAGDSVTIRLTDDLDVSRGDLIAAAGAGPEPRRELDADVCWMADAPLRGGGRYLVKHTTRTARAVVDAVVDRVDVATLGRDTGATQLALNDIGRVRLRTAQPLAADPYRCNRATGSFIVIDEASNETVGAGMVR